MAVAALACALVPRSRLPAQSLSLRRTPASESSALRCPAPARSIVPSAADRDKARQLTTLGHEAAIAGDARAARDLFAQAARLNPAAEDVAYHLARAYEALGAAGDAVREYCRYLALAPAGPDAADVTERIAQLASRTVVTPQQATVQFRAGVEHFDRRRYREAERAFTSALASAPDWAAAYYNRAVTYAADRQPERALRDLERYLELVPETRERAAIVRQIAALRRQALVPSTALTRGLLLPGLGQHYTRRPVLGLVVLGAVGGAAYYAVRPERASHVRNCSYVDPFGMPVECHFTETIVEYPHVVPGAAAALGMTAAAATEAFVYARRQRPKRSARQRVSATHDGAGAPIMPSLFAGPGLLGAGVQLPFGRP